MLDRERDRLGDWHEVALDAGRAVRLDIARAATHLLALHGMDGTTVDMIAERAGISPRTFFNYVATKAEVVLTRTR